MSVRWVTFEKRGYLCVSTGKVYEKAKNQDIGGAIAVIRYYAGWADKIQGKTIEVSSIVNVVSLRKARLT